MWQLLSNWSFGRVLLVCGGWVLVCVVAVAAWVGLQFRGAAGGSGSGGIGAVSFSINVMTLLIPTAPPAVLIVAWLLARWFHSRPVG